ncbi:TonB-dependent receptor plug domain-containing protein [Fluviicola taffensis]|uniref:TonB-dependent receptor n=1 Tax=Fluviicola taffensis (strain DSM 16823 / NCIMB 13979 / RW262) TaxID=755732 RepID=F2I9K1_FLUTR|nr:TonB-dependent receptor [Fluviicola taffensis]AEA45182.1 TonB-dependent receptor [Fluviicola taffensis DSM 16823]
MLKTNVLLAIIACISSFTHAQKLQIVDDYTKQPIANAVVVQNQKTYTSNAIGLMDLTGITVPSEILLEHPNYTSKTIQISNNELTVISLLEKTIDLDEVTVSSSRFLEKKSDVPKRIETIRSSEIQRMNQSSTADLLASNGAVFIQKSQLGGGSPVIRGFETNKILLVVDGIPLNNAIYRGGHLQNVLTIDPAALESVEIVYGPGSVVYGSDALGGVMHFHTMKPQFSETDSILIKTNSFARYFSAANGFSGHASLNLGWKRWSSFTSFTYSHFGDLTQGKVRKSKYPDFGERTFYVDRINDVDSMVNNSNKNKQVGSAYSQYDIIQKIAFKQNDHIVHTLNMQLSNSSDIDRYDRLTQTKNGLPRFSEWYYGPQFRALIAYDLSINQKSKIYDQVKVNASQQWIEESRHDRAYKSDFLNHRTEKVLVSTLLVDLEKRLGKHEIRYGIFAKYDQVQSTANKQNILVDTSGSLDTRYPDGGSSMSTGAIYVTDVIEISDKFILSGGIRANYVHLKAKFNDRTFYPFPYSEAKQNNSALNGNLGVILQPIKSIRISLNGSTGFRAPNIDDLAKVFESVVETNNTSGKLVVPNTNLKPETVYSGELGISYRYKDNIQVSALGYYSRIENVIAILPSTLNGSDTAFYNNNYVDVYSAKNANYGIVYGAEGSIKAQFLKHWVVTSSINYTQGRVYVEGDEKPLDHIPPVYGKTSLQFTWKKLQTEFFTQYSGWKKLADYSDSGEDNLAYATADGMPNWITYNLRIGYQFNSKLSAQVACENILDQNYRTFASNISAPGRNFIVTLRLNTF